MAKRKAAAGSGTIRQRPNGKWEARFRYTDEYGKTQRKSLYADTEREARRKLTAALSAADQNSYHQPERITVAAWLEQWLTTYCTDLKPNTVNTYRSRIEKDILPYIGTVQLGALKNAQIQRMLNTLSKGDEATGRKALAPKTVNCTHGVLHKALEQAKVAGLIAQNPSDGVKLPKMVKPELKPLMDDSLNAFVQAIRGHEFELVYLVALFTGLRQSEILGLQWADIEPGLITVRRQWQRNIRGGGYIIVESPKNRKPRKVTASDGVMELFAAQRRRQAAQRLAAGPLWEDEAGFVFTNGLGQPLHHGTVYKSFKKLVASIGIPESRFHDLRHSYAINALAAGDNVKSVADNLGHFSAAFTMDVYGETSEAMRARSRSIIDQVMEEARTPKKAAGKG